MEMKNISSAQDVICLSFKVIKHEEAEFEELEEEWKIVKNFTSQVSDITEHMCTIGKQPNQF